MARLHLHMRRSLFLILLVLLADQYTKYLVSVRFDLYDYHPVTSWFGWTLAHNQGAAFSFLSQAGGWQRWLFAGTAIIICILLFAWIRHSPAREKIKPLAISLILGGALGNLLDRIIHGYVIDFILLHYKSWYFPAFNIADSAITAGVALLIIKMIFSKK